MKIGSVSGIPVRVHWSFLLALPILAVIFGQHFLAAADMAEVPREELGGQPWMWGLGLTLLLFLSVLVHELAHALYARRKGARVVDITLLMIGGVSRIGEPDRPRDEAIMALAGPLTSLVLGLAGLGLFFATPAGWVELRLFFVILGEINLLLGLFNLLPAFPMDGGRILRASLSGWLGGARATSVAGIIGKLFAAAFVVMGLLGGGFFLALIGLFVFLGADAEVRQMRMRDMLGDVRVRDLMTRMPPSLPARTTIRTAAERMQAEQRVAYTVVEDGRVLGVLTLEDVAAVPDERRGVIEAVDVAHPAPAVAPEDEVWKALRTMGESEVPVLPVVDHGELVGSIDQAAILRGIELRGLGGHSRPAA
ncbi:MAG TPA: M50 family metallopeptidase [Kofleriaceae bacterium]|nr:M50 family metallopeptidase [Kofleriaceae bacterium]